MTPTINPQRLLNTINTLGKIGKNHQGTTRLALTDTDKKARDQLIKWLNQASLDIKIDNIGNIYGTRKATTTNPPIVLGSHIDTVKNAGIYDGALGVLAALETINTLNDQNIETHTPITVAAFTNEEGARFQPDMMGSMVHTKALPVETAWNAQDDTGNTVKQELQRIGYLGKDTIEAGRYIELHVEQGPILHTQKTQIGIVEGIQGMAWWDATYTGEPNHAGTTPLTHRHDTLLAAAETCIKLRETAENIKGSVATMGRLHNQPDIRNVIPGHTFFTVDYRQYQPDLYEKGQRIVADQIKKTAQKHGLEYTIKQTVDAKPVRFDPTMVNLIETKTKKLGYTHTRIHSGAGHDAQFLTHTCPTAMIFVPSINGKSHSPQEKTNPHDLVNGANLLYHTALELAKPHR
jgi:beta-ureidopropionase / N-carbamoyl-L-amino-acid hydrolase